MQTFLLSATNRKPHTKVKFINTHFHMKLLGMGRTCPRCGGNGTITCPRCGETGEIIGVLENYTCRRCDGQGEVTCPRCGGTGEI